MEGSLDRSFALAQYFFPSGQPEELTTIFALDGG